MSKKNKKQQPQHTPSVDLTTSVNEQKTENNTEPEVVVAPPGPNKLDVLTVSIVNEARLLLHQKKSSIVDLIEYAKQYEEQVLKENESK